MKTPRSLDQTLEQTPTRSRHISPDANTYEGLQSDNDLIIIKTTPAANPFILIIEDEVIGIDMLKLMLKKYTKSHFIIAKDGASALACYRKYLLQLSGVFMDIMLPDINGFDLIKKFKTISATKPIIACTAYNDSETTHRLLEHGFFGYLGKPYSDADLFAKCNLLLLTQKTQS
ncbi:hypothetical protein COTS27_00718 [Spirochaetota bacterium]|nr:hypothetical protein COTS27_00718 [Spirochaetota bacterium]